MKTALIADDSSFMRTFIRRILENEGFKIVGEAENGVICIEKYKEYWPKFVTLDLNMDEMDGIETLRNLIEINPDVKVLMISAMGQDIIIKEAILIGAKDFIVKPFKISQLISVVNRIMKY